MESDQEWKVAEDGQVLNGKSPRVESCPGWKGVEWKVTDSGELPRMDMLLNGKSPRMDTRACARVAESGKLPRGHGPVATYSIWIGFKSREDACPWAAIQPGSDLNPPRMHAHGQLSDSDRV